MLKNQLPKLLPKGVDAIRAMITRQVRFRYENIPIVLDSTSYRRIFNWIAVEASITLRREQPWGLPTFLQIEPSTKCNLRCNYCPVSEPSEKPTGHVDLAWAEKLLDEVGDWALLLVLWGWGEPFLSPDVYRIVRHAHQRGIKVLSSTNGHLFADENKARELVESGIDYLIVSTSGMSEESYGHSRQGSFELPLRGVRNILEWRDRLGLETPYLSLGVIVTSHNEHEVQEAMAQGAALGVDMLSLKRLNPTTKSGDSAMPTADHFKRFTYDENGQPRRVKVNPCKAMFHKTTLRWDGKINSCTYDFHGVSDLGDLKTSSFRSIWRGQGFRQLRRKFRRNYRDIDICTQCTYAFEGGDYPDAVAESHELRSSHEIRTTQPRAAGRRLDVLSS